MTTTTELRELRERVDKYVMALIVDGAAVEACKRAMDEAFEAVEAALRSRPAPDASE